MATLASSWRCQMADPDYLNQILYALDRQANDLERQADVLMSELDYGAEFPASDARRLREATDILRGSRWSPLTPTQPGAYWMFDYTQGVQKAKVCEISRSHSNPEQLVVKIAATLAWQTIESLHDHKILWSAIFEPLPPSELCDYWAGKKGGRLECPTPPSKPPTTT